MTHILLRHLVESDGDICKSCRGTGSGLQDYMDCPKCGGSGRASANEDKNPNVGPNIPDPKGANDAEENGKRISAQPPIYDQKPAANQSGQKTPADRAHDLGLTNSGWGRWADETGKIVAKTIDNKLVKVDQHNADVDDDTDLTGDPTSGDYGSTRVPKPKDGGVPKLSSLVPKQEPQKNNPLHRFAALDPYNEPSADLSSDARQIKLAQQKQLWADAPIEIALDKAGGAVEAVLQSPYTWEPSLKKNARAVLPRIANRYTDALEELLGEYPEGTPEHKIGFDLIDRYMDALADYNNDTAIYATMYDGVKKALLQAISSDPKTKSQWGKTLKDTISDLDSVTDDLQNYTMDL